MGHSLQWEHPTPQARQEVRGSWVVGGTKTGAKTPDLQGRRDVLGAWCPDGAQASGSGALTSLNSWIWACSNMEKTLEEPRWACLVAAALLRVPAFLLACNHRWGWVLSPAPQRLPAINNPRTFLGEPGPRVLLLSLETTSLGPAQAQKYRLHAPSPEDSTWESAGLESPTWHSPSSLSAVAWLPQGAHSPLYVSALSPGMPNKDRRRG